MSTSQNANTPVYRSAEEYISEKPNVIKVYRELLRNSWLYAYGQRAWIPVTNILGIMANITLLLQPFALGQLINHIQYSEKTDIVGGAVMWLMLYLVLIGMYWSLNGPARILEGRLAHFTKATFYKDYFMRMVDMPMDWHEKHPTGSLLTRLSKGGRSMQSFFEMQSVNIAIATNIVGATLALMILSPISGLCVGVLVFFMFVIMQFFDRVLMNRIEDADEKDNIFFSRLTDFINNIRTVKSYDLSSFSMRTLTKAQRDIFKVQRPVIKWEELKWFVLSIMLVITSFIVLLVFIMTSIDKDVFLIGTMVMVFLYLAKIDSALISFAQNYRRLMNAHTDLRSATVLYRDLVMLSQRKPKEQEKELDVDQGALHFQNISFAYNQRQKALDQMELSIPARQKVGIVGVSGSGKTTLLNLLLRFYDPQGGEIFIDRQNITDVSSGSLMQNIAVIPQDISLFDDTLRENIRFGRLNATDAEVEEAGVQAYVDQFVKDLPQGYSTPVGPSGAALSVGQRQRIAIARAILKDAPILVLDEATSALDSESERLVQDALDKIMAKKTVIAIAHRLSTIRHLDRILVFDKGRVVEDGTHDELLREEGIYYNLWQMQSNGFLPDLPEDDFEELAEGVNPNPLEQFGGVVPDVEPDSDPEK
ncbi:MAG: ABC transporter ATP-binding protein [Pseudomonadota bacterium]|nr:ABC transporter ATP-binding protein [Pseudomonadota bacterium]